jgi:2-dehydropantoate 2-reductase
MSGEYRFGIVGVGPVGGILATHLASAGHSVVLVDPFKSHMDAVKKHGLTLTGLKEMTAKFPAENILYSIDDLQNVEIDTIFIAVKTPLLGVIIPQLKHILQSGATIISIQNGMDTERFIANTFGDKNVMRIVPNFAGNLISDGNIRFTFFNAPNYIGVIHSSKEKMAAELADLLTGADLDTKFTTEIQKHVWEKVLLNSALSAICSLTGKTMAQIMTHEPTVKLVENTLREGIDVAKASGIDLDDGFFDFSMKYLGSAGHHYPSMYFDVVNKIPTEIDFINAKVVEYGLKHNIATPYNFAISRLIKGKELPVYDES